MNQRKGSVSPANWRASGGFPATVLQARAAGIAAGRKASERFSLGRPDPSAAWLDAGLAGPPAADGAWHEDVLGAGFQARTLPLSPDSEGEVVATLVRHVPVEDPFSGVETNNSFTPKRAVLFIHGWNDYFSLRNLARFASANSCAFYALDLRKYGRSWRSYQTFGFTDSLAVYDEEIGLAFEVIKAEYGADFPLVLMGHSTGGLTCALWAHRHRGVLSGLVLDSPWLELASKAITREVMSPIIGLLAKRDPYAPFNTGGSDFYGVSLDPWEDTTDPLPSWLADFPEDPAFAGWFLHPRWKHRPGAPTRNAWLRAVMAGHEQVAKGLNIDCPVLVLCADSTSSNGQWEAKLRRCDPVLDPDMIAVRAARLGRYVTVSRHECRHEVMMSDPDVRVQVEETLATWLGSFVSV